MVNTDRLVALDDFATQFIKDKSGYTDVRTEDLAEQFRVYFGLPAFPSLLDLKVLCARLGVAVTDLPTDLGLSGLNTWSAATGHSIYLRSDVSRAHYEHTVCHELREVIEQTFCRVKPAYAGLKTHDNKNMNPESNHFAGCLLMQAEATRRRLRALGFDVVAFAAETERSLSSVILRVQEVYSKAAVGGITGGVWLFEQPWTKDEYDGVWVAKMNVKYRAHLCGFSLDKSGSAHARLARTLFPMRGSSAADFEATLRAFRTQRPFITTVDGLDLFGDQNYIVGAEPLLSAYNVPSRIVVTAVQRRYAPDVQAWLARLGVDVDAGSFQRA